MFLSHLSYKIYRISRTDSQYLQSQEQCETQLLVELIRMII